MVRMLPLIALLVAAATSATATDGEAGSVRAHLRRLAAERRGDAVLHVAGAWLAHRDAAGERQPRLDALASFREHMATGFAEALYDCFDGELQPTVDALTAIGDATGAELLRAAIAVLGDDLPVEDQTTRALRIEQLGKTAESAWLPLDGRWRAHETDLDRSLLAWVAARGDRLKLLERPAQAEVLSATALLTPAAADDWHAAIEAATDIAGYPTSHDAQPSEAALRDLPVSVLSRPPEELHVFLISAADPSLARWCDALADLAPLVHLRCIVVGPGPEGFARHDAWLLAVPAVTGDAVARTRAELAAVLRPHRKEPGRARVLGHFGAQPPP